MLEEDRDLKEKKITELNESLIQSEEQVVCLSKQNSLLSTLVAILQFNFAKLKSESKQKNEK